MLAFSHLRTAGFSSSSASPLVVNFQRDCVIAGITSDEDEEMSLKSLKLALVTDSPGREACDAMLPPIGKRAIR
jgi:hypothetical protein